MSDTPPVLSDGERHLIGVLIDRWLSARDAGRDKVARHRERELARVLARFYPGVVFDFSGLAISADEHAEGHVRAVELVPVA